MKNSQNLTIYFNMEASGMVPLFTNGDTVEVNFLLANDPRVEGLDDVASVKAIFRNMETGSLVEGLASVSTVAGLYITYEVNPLTIPAGQYKVRLALYSSDGSRVTTRAALVQVV